MIFDVKNENDSVLILVNSRLDSTTAGEFDEEIKKVIPTVSTKMILDFKNVDFISSIGLRVIVAAYRELAAAGHEMIIREANSSVKEIFRLSGLLKVLKIE